MIVNVPRDLKYTETHEWVKIEGNVATIGITDHAQHELTDIVYIDDFPAPGDPIKQGGVIAIVESVKAVSDVYSPVAGTLLEINDALEKEPARLNTAPYDAWIAKVTLAGTPGTAGLLDPAAYEALIAH